MTEVHILARYVLRAEHREEALTLLTRLREASLAEPGCRSYEIYQHFDDPLEVVLVERYADRAAVDAHRATVHFAELVTGGILPLLRERVAQLLVPSD